METSRRLRASGRGFHLLDSVFRLPAVSDEYLTTAEVARRLRLHPRTVRNKIAAGIFREGEHYFRRPGLGPRWRWDRVVAWLEGEPPAEQEDSTTPPVVPLAEPGGRRLR